MFNLNKKRFLLLLIVCFLGIAVIFTGCDTTADEDVYLSGFVTHAKEGPGLEGVKVSLGGYSAETCEDGKFEMVVAEGTYDLIAVKEGYGSFMVQKLKLEKDEEKELVIDLHKTGKGLTEPPRINVENVSRDMVLSGEHEFDIFFDSPFDLLEGKIQFGKKGGEEDYYIGSHTFSEQGKEFESVWDTETFTNGDTYLRIQVRDVNHNITKKTIPVTIDNELDETVEAPGPPEISLISMNWGKQTLKWFGDNQKEVKLPTGEEVSVEFPPDEDVSVYNYISFDDFDETTQGFRIFRSFCGEEFEVIGETTDSELYFDFHPEIEAGEPAYYKVQAYNRGGVGEATEAIKVVPLPRINLKLISPEDGGKTTTTPEFEVEISRKPYELEIDGEVYQEQYQLFLEVWESEMDEDYRYSLYDPTHEEVDEDNRISMELTGDPLQQNFWYRWDIKSFTGYESFGYTSYVYEGYPVYLYTYFGYRDGSLNGEFEFLTSE